MGTKLNPGKFDCHAAAEPDEPMFVLLARDPLAPFLVSVWASMRMGDLLSADLDFRKMLAEHNLTYLAHPELEKAGEASVCANAMRTWRRERRK